MAEHAEERQRRITPRQWRLIVAAVLLILFGIFVAKNSGRVEVHFVFFRAEIRLIWIFLLCGVIGMIVDRLLQRHGTLPGAERRWRRRKD